MELGRKGCTGQLPCWGKLLAKALLLGAGGQLEK